MFRNAKILCEMCQLCSDHCLNCYYIIIFLFSYAVDYDIVAFVNDVRPPFRDVLKDFKHVILQYFNVEEKDFKQTKRSLSFHLEGVQFDLLPATNMARSKNPGWLYFCFHSYSRFTTD